MEDTHLFALEALNAPTILPRITLVLSRRRLTPERMNFAIASDSRFCTFEFTVRCDRGTADRLKAQLARVVELIEVSVNQAPPMPRSTAQAPAFAAA